MIKIYTDGASTMFLEDSGYIRGPGGWGFVCVENGEVRAQDSGGKSATTNQEMELTGIYKALLFAAELPNKEIEILSDSAYCINIYTVWAAGWERNNWRRRGNKEIINLELIKATWGLLKELKRDGFKIKFTKVKGHSGNKDFNDYVDKLAVKAKQSFL